MRLQFEDCPKLKTRTQNLKIMLKTKILKFLTGLAALALLTPLAMAADYLPVQVFPTNTTAGYPSALRTSLIQPNQDVRFVVEKPDGGVVQVPAQADLEGIAKADFYGHQTKIAGTYKVALVYPGSPTSSPQALFQVYPDQVSTSQSTLRSTEQLVEANETTFVVATLYDQYRNPIPNHHIKLVSSRSEDIIETLQQGVTDANGRANFKVRSPFPGISVFTAMDVTISQILDDRVEIVFFAPSAPAVTSPFSASLLGADIGGEGDVLPGPVDHFDIGKLPSTAKVGEELSLTIVAKDKDNNTAKNYTGTVLISVPDDENAILPSNGEYTFKASDQGSFTFDLSLMFSKIGKQVLQVFDKNDFKVSGEFPIEIISKTSVVPGPTASDLSIKSPADGSELGSNLVIVTGQGKENINLKIFDNDTKIGDTETDSDGFFSFEAKNLESGSHTFYGMTDDGKVSKSVTITVDTLAPTLNAFSMNAEGDVVPGTPVTITIQSEPNLEEAKVRLQGIEEMLSESASEAGTYEVTVAAPGTSGQFPVDVILIDSLSNKSEFRNQGVISVKAPEDQAPPTVEGLEGTPGDGIIDLTWNPVESDERTIQKYRIAYGTSMDQLDQQVDTLDDSAHWQLRGLTNDIQYFVAVTAVDSKDLESEARSTVIAATPFAADLCAAVDCGEHGACNEGQCTCDQGWSGLTCNVQSDTVFPSAPVTQITATPYDSGATLYWPAFTGVQAYYYKIFLGFAPGQYTDAVITPNNQTSFAVKDLINNVPYYFAVAALDINGNQISPLSQEVAAIPSGSAFRPAAPNPIGSVGALNTQPVLSGQLKNAASTSQTGPEALWLVFGSVVFASFLYSHKRKLLPQRNR